MRSRAEEVDKQESGEVKNKLTSDITNYDVDEIQEILVVLEFYSSDFYRDKLQGWTYLTIPIELNKAYHYLSTSSSSSVDRRQLTKCTCTHKPNQLLLPVVRPELCSIIDKLRYYFIGQFPNTIPEVDNVSRVVELRPQILLI